MATGETTTGSAVLRGAIRRHRRHLGFAGLLLCGHQAGEALVPVLVGVVIDQAVSRSDPGALLLWLIVLAGDFLLLSTCYRFGARTALVADVRADQELRLELTERVLHPQGGAEAGRLPGGLANIAVSDAKRVGVLNFALPIGLAGLVALVVATIALLTISIPLGLLILLGTPPLLFVVHALAKPLERRSGPEQERAAQASGVAADLVTGVRVLKGIGAEPAAVRRYIGTSRDALQATLRATGAQARYQGTVLALNGLFLALVALVGGRLAADGAITIGGLVAAVGLALFLEGPLQTLGWVSGRFAQARASATRIAEVLSAESAVTAGTRALPTDVPGALRIRDLRHGPLDGIDLDVAAGELVGVVTRDVAEATALMHSLGREVEPAGGAVELDGVGLTEYPPASARAAVLVAAHDADLFAGTLDENVRAGAPPGGDVGAAMAAARADQVADALPDGAGSAVSEQGRSLSGGQRQRVALARALATEAPVVVLHDPTTAVDTVTEAAIAAGIREVRTGRTTIVLTTSPALLAAADRVVVLQGGRITAEGTHADLMHTDADYRATVLA